MFGEKSRTPDPNSDEYNYKILTRIKYHFDKKTKQWVKDKGPSGDGSATPKVRPLEQGQSSETQRELFPMAITPTHSVQLAMMMEMIKHMKKYQEKMFTKLDKKILFFERDIRLFEKTQGR